MRSLPAQALLVWLALLAEPALSQQKSHLELDSTFGSFVEPDFPFFCQTLDAREFGDSPESTNLTPRGIIVKLGHGHYGCFDPDLLRWSLIWQANEDDEYLTMDGMAPGSYRLPNRKAPSGQRSLPRPIGTPLRATPALPGVSPSGTLAPEDPRDPGGADAGEVGLGPVPVSIGRFSGIRLTSEGPVLEYQVGSTSVTERAFALETSEGIQVRRHFRIEANPGNSITIRKRPGDSYLSWHAPALDETDDSVTTSAPNFFLIRSRKGSPSPDSQNESGEADASKPVKRFWPETVTTGFAPSPAKGPFTYDDLELPLPNPWKRNVRLSGLDFFPDGAAALCTFDGDVWIVEGIGESGNRKTWSRFASGLHEPMSLSIVDGTIHVFDRNGIVRLHDTDGNDEADWYENFSNVVPQTAETREFAMDMAVTPKGEFLLAKGGQVGSTRGPSNGTIARVSRDGRSFEIIATGLRQPYIGYDPASGILTSSDQQGNWKPATPIYRIDEGAYYGFQPAKLKDKAVHPAPIDDPEVWIPHFINSSGASQVWMKGAAAMGALDGSLVHIGYNRPELFRVFLHESRGQGAVVPFLSGFPSGILHGAIHPEDGRLYLCGFEIWGTSGARVSGLFRVRPTGEPSWIPSGVEAGRRGILLTFDQPLSPELAVDLARYSVDRWNYRQTHRYGSGNFRLDGSPGQESVAVSSARLSEDRHSLFLGMPGMKPSHSLRVTYRLPIPDSDSDRVESAYLTIHELEKMDLTTRGFGDDEVDLSPKHLSTGPAEEIEPSPEIGREVAIRYGCVACHETGEEGLPTPVAVATDGSELAVGPPWLGLWRSRRTFTDGSFIKSVDETYLRESILDPGRRVAEGFEMETAGVGMPSYLGVLKDHEVESIILYIQTLRKKSKK